MFVPLARAIRFTAACVVLATTATPIDAAEIEMPTIFGDSMVLQRDKPIHVWGWTDPGSDVVAELDQARQNTTANAEGRFDLWLPPMAHDDAKAHRLTIRCGDDSLTFEQVLIGEVYLCSGQSNMAWPVNQAADADLEKCSAHFPNIRIISVPNRAAQEPQRHFEGQWQAVAPETIGDFSAVGYFFGRQIHLTIGVPVGLIDNAWGGSSAEAWVPWETLGESPLYDGVIDQWQRRSRTYDYDAILKRWETKIADWRKNAKKGPAPRRPQNAMTGQQRPGNLYYGCLTPVIGYSIRGVIWYQGESNRSRADQYHDLFSRLIQKWRSDWDDEFSFYWVQLADFLPEVDSPQPSQWAALREAQTRTLDLPKTGQAVIIDLGESNDIHPADKQTVAKRLARWSLAKDFGIDIAHRSPTFESMTIEGDKILVDFEFVGGGLESFDVDQVRGFAIAAADGKFVFADAEIIDRDTVKISSESVPDPTAVRYGWADNPVVNLQSTEGLPATPFRSPPPQN